MIDCIRLPELDHAEITELARMLLGRKLMPEDRRGTLSPMVNSVLRQCVMLQADIPVSLAAWLPRLKKQFATELSDRDADPSLSRYLQELADDTARMNMIRQYFLPFQPVQESSFSSAEAAADIFNEHAELAPEPLDMGPLYPVTPQVGSIVLPSPFAWSIFDQILIGRHSHIHLEMRRQGGTNQTASDAVIRALIDTLAASSGGTEALQPFHARQLRQQDFAQSFAYTQMMELGFSREETMAALSPWELMD